MKKISSLFLLTAAISLVSAVPTFAANESSTNASPPSFDSIAPFVAGKLRFLRMNLVLTQALLRLTLLHLL